MTSSFLSVIIPTFRRDALLRQCLSSLTVQTAAPTTFEVIVVDNACSEDTANLVGGVQSENPGFDITYVREARPGLVHARHTGAACAKYPILLFGDDDGIYGRDWVSEVARFYSAHPQVSAVGGKITIRWDRVPPTWIEPYEGLLGKLDYGCEIPQRRNLYINGGNFGIKKDVLLKVGGFNPDQIGDYIVGDGETGLCRKLHRGGFLIGWTPLAAMEHQQFVDRHATKTDIRRRYANNGVADAFEDIIVAGYASRRSAARMLLIYTKRLVSQSFKTILKRNESLRLAAEFEAYGYLAQIKYTLKLLLWPAFYRQVTEAFVLRDNHVSSEPRHRLATEPFTAGGRTCCSCPPGRSEAPFATRQRAAPTSRA